MTSPSNFALDRADALGDRIQERIASWQARVGSTRDQGLYFFNQPVDEILSPTRVRIGSRELIQFASYSYLGLLGHPEINAAAAAAIGRWGTGTHGVRLLAGSLNLHRELEQRLARFTGRAEAITFSSGYVTNLTAIATLVGRHDVVFSDRLNHASIVDGCQISGATFVRYRHNDASDLERRLAAAPAGGTRLVVTDAVFSMDGDIVDLPALSAVCRRHGAWLMVDEAHSIGVLGATGHGLEEHFGLTGVIDLKMGTLSKTIPSVGGYIAASADVIRVLRHASRGYIFSAALPPAQAAAALTALDVIEREPWRVTALKAKSERLRRGLSDAGFDILQSQTAVVPIVCGSDERAYAMTRACQERGIFALPVISPAVPANLARIRATVTAAHTDDEIAAGLDVFRDAGAELGLIRSMA